MCSLGPSAEFTPEVLRRARRVVAVVNRLVPRVKRGCSLSWSAISRHIEADTPLATYETGTPDATSEAIAANVARYVGDDATLQVGLGKAPHALMRALRGRRRLRLHSGMISDGVIGLAESGALDPTWTHVTTAVLGGAELYSWIAERPDIAVFGVDRVHAPEVLAAIDGFVAVNSALEVDLFGQCNLETADGRAVSGVGGAADFARAARLSPGGVSVVALPSTFGAGLRSRIRARLGGDSVASLARTEVDVIVTEHGAADLRGRSVHERAESIIEVAAPEARPELADRWREIAARL
jgi:acyl-CoA hydrolase